MNNSAQAKKFTYVIMDEYGKEFKVSFDHAHQIDTWISMELNLHGKKYTVVGVRTVCNK